MAEPLQPPDSEMPRRKLSFSDSDGLSTSTSAAPERMQAFVRLRPLSGKEARATIATTETDCTISLNKPSAQGYGTIEEHSFSFDGVFGPDASQPEVYEAVMRPQVQALLEGRDTLTFAYGITNAGKTYTVQGGAAPEQRGVLPRALCSIFGALDALRAGGEAAAGSRLDPSCSYKVAASFLEIYGAEAHDLLAPAEKAGSWWQGIRGRGPVPLRIKEGGGKVSVDGLKEAVWADLAEALAAVEYGWANRQSASNGVNDVSSRSHAVLSIKLLVTPTGESKPKVTRLTVVDLAGAEKQKLTQSSGERLNEANAINKDLMVLGHCLRDLRWNQSHPKGTQRVPPYRNSRITMLFRDFLSGSGQTVVIAALNPRAIDAQSTLETLRFASVAQQIKTRPAPAPAKEAPAKEAPKRPPASQSASERTSDGGGDAPDSYVLYEQVLALQERLQQLEAERLGDERRIREEVSAEMQQHMEEMHESLTHSNQEQLASTEESYHKKMLLHKGRHEQSAVDGHVEMQKQHRDSARKDIETLSRISSTNAQLEAARAEVQRLTAKLAEAGSAGGAAAARPEPDTLRREAAEAVEARQLAEGAQAQAEGALQVAKADAAAARATATAAEARATAAEARATAAEGRATAAEGRATAAEGRAAELEERCAAAAGDAERVGKKLQAAEAEAAGLRAQIATLPPVMPPPLLVASSSESGAQVEPRPAEAVAGTAAAADRVLSPKRGLESSINRAAAAAGGGGASPAKKARGSFRASEEEEEEGGGEAAGLKPKPSKLGGLLRNLGGKGKADGSPSVEQLSNFFGGRSSRASTSARASFRAPSHRASTREPEAVPEAAPEPEPAGAKSKLPEPTPISKRTRSSRRNAQAA